MAQHRWNYRSGEPYRGAAGEMSQAEWEAYTDWLEKEFGFPCQGEGRGGSAAGPPPAPGSSLSKSGTAERTEAEREARESRIWLLLVPALICLGVAAWLFHVIAKALR